MIIPGNNEGRKINFHTQNYSYLYYTEHLLKPIFHSFFFNFKMPYNLVYNSLCHDNYYIFQNISSHFLIILLKEKIQLFTAIRKSNHLLLLKT